MDEREMLHRLRTQRREAPDGFDRRTDARLHSILREKAGGRRPGGRRLRLAAALMALMATGVFALQQSGLLSFREPYMREAYYFTLPEARELVHPLDASLRFAGWQARLEEVLYDGRWMKLLYTVTDQSATLPFTQQQKDAIHNGDTAGCYALFAQADAHPTTETSGSLLINGRQVNIYSAASGAGDAPGEYQFVVDSQLELSAQGEMPSPFLRPEGEIELTLPFTNSQGVQVGALTARFDAGDAARRYALPLPAPVPMKMGRLVFHDLFLSPAHAVLAYSVFVEGAQADQAGDALPGIRLVNVRGERLGTLKDAVQHQQAHPDGQVELRYHLTYTPPATQEPLYLLLPDGQTLPLPR